MNMENLEIVVSRHWNDAFVQFQRLHPGLWGCPNQWTQRRHCPMLTTTGNGNNLEFALEKPDIVIS